MADSQLVRASKRVTLGGHSFDLAGVSAEDAYWQSIQDDYEPEFLAFFRQFIQRDYICLDIGANIGTKTLFLSRHCRDGRVIALEAGSEVEAVLAHNIAANGCTNAVSYHAAAAGHGGTLTFAEGSAWGHESKGGVSVEAITLETLVSRHDLNRVDFIKIDIEGAEFPVLKSSLDLINRFETLVLVEFNALGLLVWGNTNPREFAEWIGDNFSHVYALNRNRPGQPLLTPIVTNDECWTIMYRNLVEDSCVTDLVLSNTPGRFKPTREHLEDQILELSVKLSAQVSALQAENADLQAKLKDEKAELAAVHRDNHGLQARLQDEAAALAALQRDAVTLRAERSALLTSTSWRVSAPVRWAKRASRGLRGRAWHS